MRVRLQHHSDDQQPWACVIAHGIWYIFQAVLPAAEHQASSGEVRAEHEHAPGPPLPVRGKTELVIQ